MRIEEKAIWKNLWPSKISNADLAGTLLELWPIWSNMTFPAKFSPNKVADLFSKHYGIPFKEALSFFNEMIDRIFGKDKELLKILQAIPGAIQESVRRINRMSEIRDGDIKARAGLIITDGQYLLACKPTPSSRWPNPMLDIPKGHIQQNEYPMNAAIRECYEETNILFESWKLNRPMRFMMEGEPLFLWEVRLTELPPIEMLSCPSTFVDNATGQRHSEMAGYEYIHIFDTKRNGGFAAFQDRLRPCVEAYFTDDIVYPFEDHRICADKLNLPDGLYTGLHTAYFITLANGLQFKTIWGVRGRNVPCGVEIRGGLVYDGRKA